MDAGPMTKIDPKDGPALSMKFVTEGVANFAAEMREKGIHVGINGFCPVDGEAWPCSDETCGREGLND